MEELEIPLPTGVKKKASTANGIPLPEGVKKKVKSEDGTQDLQIGSTPSASETLSTGNELVVKDSHDVKPVQDQENLQASTGHLSKKDYFQKLPSESAAHINYTPVERSFILGTIDRFNTNPVFNDPEIGAKAKEKYFISLLNKGVDVRKIIDGVNLENNYQNSDIIKIAQAPIDAIKHGAGELGEAYKAVTPTGVAKTIGESVSRGASGKEIVADVIAKPVQRIISGAFGLAGGTPAGAAFYTLSKALEKKAPLVNEIVTAELMPFSSSLGEDSPEWKKLLATTGDAVIGAIIFGAVHPEGKKGMPEPKDITPDLIKRAVEWTKNKTPEQLAKIQKGMQTPEIMPEVMRLVDLENDIAKTNPDHPAAETLIKKHKQLTESINNKVDKISSDHADEQHNESVTETLNQTKEKLVEQQQEASEEGKIALQEDIDKIDEQLHSVLGEGGIEEPQSEPTIEPIKPTEDAIPKPSTEEIPVQEPPGDSKSVGEGVPEPEEPTGVQKQQGKPRSESITSPDDKERIAILDKLDTDEVDEFNKIFSENGIDKANEFLDEKKNEIAEREREVPKEELLSNVSKYNSLNKTQRKTRAGNSLLGKIQQGAKQHEINAVHLPSGKIELSENVRKVIRPPRRKSSSESIAETKNAKAKRKEILTREPSTLGEWIAQYVMGGGKISENDFLRNKGLGKKDRMKGVFTKDGSTFHDLWQAAKDEIPHLTPDDNYYFDEAIADELSSHASVKDMYDKWSKRVGEMPDEYNSELMEQASAFGINLDELYEQEDIEASVRDEMSKLSDEDVKHINQLFDETKFDNTEEITNFENENGINQKDTGETGSKTDGATTAEKEVTESANRRKASKEYDTEHAAIEKKLADAKKERHNKVNSLNKKVDLFGGEGEKGKLFDESQDQSPEQISKVLKPFDDKISKLEKEKSDFENNKEDYLNKYEGQKRIDEEGGVSEPKAKYSDDLLPTGEVRKSTPEKTTDGKQITTGRYKKYKTNGKTYTLADTNDKYAVPVEIDANGNVTEISEQLFDKARDLAARENLTPYPKMEEIFKTEKQKLQEDYLKQKVTDAGETIKASVKKLGLAAELPEVTKLGGYTFENLVDVAVKLIHKGIEIHGDIKKAIDEAIEKIKEHPFYKSLSEKEKTKVEKILTDKFEPKDSNFEVSLKQSIAHKNLEKLSGTEKLDAMRSDLQGTDVNNIFEKNKADVDAGKVKPQTTIDRVIKEKRGSTDDEAVILYELAKLKTEENSLYDKLMEEPEGKNREELLKQQLANKEAQERALYAGDILGREFSNMGRLRKEFINQGMTLYSMEKEYMADKGITKLTPEQKAEIQKVYDDLKKADIKISKLEESISKLQDETIAMQSIIDSLKKDKGKSNGQRLKERTDKILEKNKNRNGKEIDAIFESAKRENAVRKVVEKMREGLDVESAVKKVSEEGFIKPENIDKAIDYIKELDADDIKTKNKIKIPKQLIRDLVEGGIKDINELTKAVQDVLKDKYPDATERNIRDAITDYGKTITMSKEKIDVSIRKMKRIGKLISGIEDVRNKKRPLRSGLQRDKLESDERQMQKELNSLMKDLPVDNADLQKQLKTDLDRVKTTLTNAIEDLQKQLDENYFPDFERKKTEHDAQAKIKKQELEELKNKVNTAKEKLGLIPSKELPKTPKNAEITRLENQIEDLQKQLDDGKKTFEEETKKEKGAIQKLLKEQVEELKEIHDAVFNDKLSDGEKAQKSVEQSEKALDKIKKKIEDNNLEFKTKGEEKNQLKLAIKERLKKANEILSMLRDEAGITEKRWNESAIKSAKRETEKLQGMIDRKEYSSPEPVKYIISPELEAARAEKAQTKLTWDLARAKDAYSKLGWFEKSVDKILKFRVAIGLLSGIKSFAKIINYSLLEVLYGEPIDIVTTGFSKLTGIANRSMTEGYINLDARKQFYKTYFDAKTWNDAKTYLTNNVRTHELYKKMFSATPEMSISGGKLHGVEKYPLWKAEFDKQSMILADYFYKQEGLDISKPEVRKIIDGLAADKANGRILQNKNIVSSLLKTAQGWMYNQGRVGKIGYYISKVLFPIISVPTNYTIKTMRSWGGMAEFALRVAIDGTGTEKMKPEQIDKALLAFKNGMPGTALAILTLTTGLVSIDDDHNLVIGGWKVPDYLTHHPHIAVLKMFAEAKKESKKEGGTAAKGFVKGVQSNIHEIPYLSDRALDLLDTPDKFNAFTQNLMLSLVEPQLLKDIASMTDKERLTLYTFWMEEPPKRYPDKKSGYLREMYERAKLGIPGKYGRESVALKPLTEKDTYTPKMQEKVDAEKAKDEAFKNTPKIKELDEAGKAKEQEHFKFLKSFNPIKEKADEGKHLSEEDRKTLKKILPKGYRYERDNKNRLVIRKIK